MGATAGMVAIVGPAAAARTGVAYEMNEGPAATRLRDSGPAGVHGVIGRDVVPGASRGAARGHEFPYVNPKGGQVRPGHLDRVAHRPRLNPGTGRFAVVVRYRTTNSFGNIVQKGQSTAAGGMWKVEAPLGRPRCLFKGGNGQSLSGFAGRDLSDGRWHTIRCVRTSSSVRMFVDGRLTSRRTGPTGRIANTRPVSIGGKLRCDQRSVSCDYFSGTIDFIRIRKG